MAVYKNNAPFGNIVKYGLVLNLDATNISSYPGSGTTWFDISGNGINGSLVNGPTFLNQRGRGSIVFDGTNDYADLGNIFNYTSENFTFSYWINFNRFTTNVVNQGPIVLYKGSYVTNGYYDQIGQSGNITFITNQSGVFQSSGTPINTITTGSWYNLTYTRNGSSIRVYVNGIDRTSTSGSHINPASSGNNFRIANYQNGFIYGNFTLANFLNYNRNLSDSEILQNYTTLKSRFGL